MKRTKVLCHFSFFSLLILLQNSCARRITNTRGAELLVKDKQHIHLNNNPNSTVKILYTGCGGLVISTGEDHLMFDPFYTGHGFWKMNRGKIQPEEKNRELVLNKIKTELGSLDRIRAVMVSHAHYDHMEDLPYLLSKKLVPHTATVIASPTAKSMLGGLIPAGGNYINADTSMYVPGEVYNANKWITLADGIHILPIKNQHAPQFYCFHTMTCPGKNENCNARVDGLEELKPTKAKQWMEGTTYSFLLDINQNGRNLRLFVQTSASQAPAGFPPAEELKTGKIDLALMCMASFKYVKNYPELHLDTLKPRKAVFIHWENFFDELYQPESRAVPFVNPGPFYKKVLKAKNLKEISQLKGEVFMPKPGAILEVNY